jgi:7-cyano-7-deazaguanine synthase
MRSVVLLSGGIDSTTCLALALVDTMPEEVLSVSMAYGQKHRAELDSARDVARHYGVGHEVLDIPSLFRGGDSTLVEGGPENPRVAYEDLPEGASPAYVPFRNGVFLSMATATALVHGATAVYFGAHSEDAARWAYPDCTPEFIGSMASAIFVGSYMKVRLLTPLQWLTKAQIVRLGTELAAPYHLTMSCYDGMRPACGTCPTCRSRREAFLANGLEDPIRYAED